MNANSSLTATLTIEHWLATNTAELRQVGIQSARLDCLILLEHVIKKDRTWLLAHLDHIVSSKKDAALSALLARRRRREPLAYITGSKEFYGRTFAVNPDVLIPRPETEFIIELLRSHTHPRETILDVGTGTGCIAISAALELPNRTLAACDISPAALAVAEHNMASFGPRLQIFRSDLLDRASRYDCIVANLPYVDPSWQRSTETDFEPALALFAKHNGLELINRLIDQAPAHLNSSGRLFLEADPMQHQAIKTYAARNFRCLEADAYWLVFTKQAGAPH